METRRNRRGQRGDSDRGIKVQGVEDCFPLQSKLLDIYIKWNGASKQAAGDFSLEDVENALMENLSKMRKSDEANATEEERKEKACPI